MISKCVKTITDHTCFSSAADSSGLRLSQRGHGQNHRLRNGWSITDDIHCWLRFGVYGWDKLEVASLTHQVCSLTESPGIQDSERFLYRILLGVEKFTHKGWETRKGCSGLAVAYHRPCFKLLHSYLMHLSICTLWLTESLYAAEGPQAIAVPSGDNCAPLI